MFNKIIDSLSSRLYMKLVPVFVLLGYYGVFYAAFRTKFTRVAVKAFAFNWPVTISNSCITYMALFLPALVICAFLLCASISRAEASHGKPAASAYPDGKESGNPQSNNGHPSSQKQPGDKKEDGEDTKPDSSADLQNKLSEDARALLELLKKLSESGNLSTQEISLLQSYLGSKNAPAGRALSDIINVLQIAGFGEQAFFLHVRSQCSISSGLHTSIC